MNAALPDISLTEHTPDQTYLDWVGMQGIDLPVTICEPDYRRELQAKADVQIDLAAGHKGIHMSRLYRLLGRLGEGEAISFTRLEQLLGTMIESHADCGSRNVRLRLLFDLLIRRPALESEGIAGWKSYPVCLDASLGTHGFALSAQVTVTYSSTCPCSAALARQMISQGFMSAFGLREQVSPEEVANWLNQHATLATPHSQRSQALVKVDLVKGASTLGLLALINHIENALGTPVQTAVKRLDEQAFAVLNGKNLMFVEDATRRIRKALLPAFANPRVKVRHLESLHPHDAVAWAEQHPCLEPAE